MRFDLGLCSVSFRNHAPEEILRAMKAAELSVIEWGSDVHCPPEKAEALAALQKRHGIKCSSYGTYFRLGVMPICELEQYIRAAKTLGTDILRLWCGNKNSEDYTEGEKKELFLACKAAADIAEQNGVVLCMECHNKTYTNSKESAYELIQAINSPCFKMYWQPNQHKSETENLEYARLLSPYTEHIHVFNWKGKEKNPLHDAKLLWQKYLGCFAADKTLLLEFMPDGRIESLKTEADTLKEIVK